MFCTSTLLIYEDMNTVISIVCVCHRNMTIVHQLIYSVNILHVNRNETVYIAREMSNLGKSNMIIIYYIQPNVCLNW